MSVATDSILARQTKAFIDANPTSVSLERFKRQATTAGGFRNVSVGTLLPVTGRIVRSSNRQGNEMERTLPEGQVVTFEYVLVLPLGTDIQDGDQFTADGQPWLVGPVTKTINASINAKIGSRG